MPKRQSSVVGREFGRGVREAFEQCGMTQRKLAELLDWDEAKLSDFLAGKGGVSELDVVRFLSYCRVPAAEVERLLALFRETREQGYLQFNKDGVLHPLRTLMGQEQLANKITGWSPILVPGYLQIAAYIRAVAEKSSMIKPADIDDLIWLKLERQAAVFRPGRVFVLYVHEQALRLPVGDADLMNAQLTHVLAMSMRPYITVRVVPTALGAHSGVAGTFIRLDYPKLAPVIYLEAMRLGLFLEDKESLTDYDDALKGLEREALDPEQSRELISSILC